jgi:signal transduction histidine kinase
MQLHRGDIEIASKPGAGTRVTLCMPSRSQLDPSLD